MRFRKMAIWAFACAFLALPLSASSQEKIQEETVKQEIPSEQKKEEPKPELTAVETAGQASVAKPRNYLDGKYLAFGASIGAQIDPGMFSVKINADYIFDGLFSLGPSFEGSFGKHGHFVMIFLDGKFRIPVVRSLPQFKLTGTAGAGYLQREIGGVDFNNFVFHAGAGAEYFILDSLSLDFEILSNITSSGTQRWFMNLFFGLHYYL